MKVVNHQNHWKFEASSQKNTNVSTWNIIGFQQQDR